ncbi:hypothetical protein AABM36_05325 [Kocuria sp. KSNUG]|uniref:hypothetical protein n=1 Tax=Kocuria sp. KSNUG TaxID=3136676 RepID=UPI003C2CE0F2
MGLRDLFRSKNTTPTPQPSPGAAPSDPAAAPVSGQMTPPEAVQNTAGEHHEHPRREPAAEPLPQDGALQHLVELLLARGADRARLTLVQSGNIMTHQTRQAVGEAQDEVENGTVDQGSPLFDDVADLYTQAMSTPVGPWRQLDLVVAAPHHAAHEITVTYDYPNGESRTEHYSHPGGGSAPEHHGVSEESRTATAAHQGQQPVNPQDHTEAADRASVHHDTPVGTGSDAHAHGTGHAEAAGLGAAAVAGGAAGFTAAGTTAEHEDHVADAHRSEQGQAPGAAADQMSPGAPQDSDAVRVVADGHTEPATDGDVLAAGQAAPVLASGEQDSAEHAEDGSPAAPSEERPVDQERAFDAQDGGFGDDAAESEEDAHFDQGLGEDPRVLDGAPTHDDAYDAQPGAEHAAVPDTQDARSAEDLPAHVDESAFGTESEDTLVPAPAVVGGDDDPAGAPQVATATDVSPSYRAPAPEQDVDPDALASGNLALTVGDVTARLADAQRHLFGPDGTAREVSTVLVRVRALGTYYDALTHVRLNGFWDQRPTFDLVPEDQLKVQELKDDSYVEGSGAPLAMMFRFRPGVPPEVAFDYSDEEAFVRYEQRLPGQNYLEELRMYPRTGSNIPQHVNDALQDWNY